MGEASINMAAIIRNAAVAGLRRSGAISRRPMSTAMSPQEQLSMEKLYPHMRTSWFGTPGDMARQGWDSTKKTWVIVEAYPLFAAIGGGCLICFTHCMRHLFFSPDVFLSKTNRANAMIENFKTGENWKGNVFRKMSRIKSNHEDPFR